MVLLPFDVHNGGGYFIFLSIFASLYLCHVQCANVDISNWIAPKPRVPMAPFPMMPMVATMAHPTARVRLQWDPGIPKNKTRCPSAVGFTTHTGYAMNVNIANVDDRDPVDVDRPPVPLHASIGPMRSLKTLSLSLITGHPGMASSKCCGDLIQSLFQCCHRPLRPIADWSSSCCCTPMPRLIRSRPTMPKCCGALALIQSLFQYFHPVLSRPTVPNIDT